MILKNNIIVALATAKGPGPLAIIRISGFEVRAFLDKMIVLKSKKKFIEITSHTINYGLFIGEDNKKIDQVIVAIMDAPRSFTGEDTAEITCHNNIFIINNIINRCIALGASMAKRGEFSQRAVYNKKIDIFQAEAINELLNAENELMTEIALSQVEGSLSSEIMLIDESLCTISAWCQASFEFLDEERDFRLIILDKLENVLLKIDSLLNMHSSMKLLKNGIRIAIIGSVNVGKSSLFNYLLGYNRAIVSKNAGTTRDTIESIICFNNYNMTLIDTAGIRLTDDEIEREGIGKSYFEADLADIILLVYSEEIIKNKDILLFYNEFIKNKNYKTIIIKNKIDEFNNEKYFENELLISTKEKIGIKNILNLIDDKINIKYNKNEISYIINTRHVENLNLIKNQINEIKNFLLMGNPLYEIILYHLLEVQKIISNLSGKNIEERSLDKVFKEFCVGK